MELTRSFDPQWIKQVTLDGWRAYALTIILSTLAGVATLAFDLHSTPYAAFIVAIVGVPFFAGLRPAMLAIALMLLFVWVFVFDGLPVARKIPMTIVGGFVGSLITGAVYGLRFLLLQLVAAKDETTRLLALSEAERDRANLLSQELRHRVKNLFAVVNSIIALSGRSEPRHKEAAGTISGRIRALAAAHTLGLASDGKAPAPLGEIVETTLAPYSEGGERIIVAGPTVVVPAEGVIPSALILHEFATNSVKYGALSEPSGQVRATWSVSDDDIVRLDWEETGGPIIDGAPEKEGFGSVMSRLVEAQLGARVDRDWLSDGLRIALTFPLNPRERATPCP